MANHLKILDRMLEGCQVIGFDWRYLYVNDALVDHARKPREELLGHTMMEAYPGIEETEVFRALKRCMEERTPLDMENEFTFPDGSSGWFELRVQPVPEGIFILSIDITARKRAEQEIERQISRGRSLRAIDLAIIGSTDLGMTLKCVLDETRDQLGADVVTVFLFNSNLVMLEAVASHGFSSADLDELMLRPGEGVAGQAALEKATVAVADLQASDQPAGLSPELIAREDIRSLFATPLVVKGQLLGVLQVGRRSHFEPEQDWLGFLEILAGQAALAIDAGRLYEDLSRSNMELALAYDSTIEGWSRALDLRDRETEGHSTRVTGMTLKLARDAGIDDPDLVHVRRGALLHDMGKLGVPDAVLFNPGRLSEEEWQLMEKHPVYAFEMLSPIDYLRPALDIPWCHHEKWDGSGYPRGLTGEQIPLSARLFAVVDVWDALNSDRPYRPKWPEKQIYSHIEAEAGSHFDPASVELFFRIQREEGRAA